MIVRPFRGGQVIKRGIRVVMVACVLYLALIYFVPLLDKLVLFPSIAPIDAAGAVRKTAVIGGGQVEMWAATSAKALAAFDEIKREAGTRPVVVSGSSFGTIAALHIAAQRPVTGLILHNPPALPEMVRANGWWNLWLFAGPLSYKIPGAIDSVANAKCVRVPAVFLLAEKDEVVAPKFQSLWLALMQKRNASSHSPAPCTTPQ